MIPDSWRNSGVAALVRVLTLDVQMTRVLTTPSPGLGLDDCPRIERRSRKMPSPPFQGNFWSSSSSENDIGSPVSIYSKSFVSGTCFSTSSVRTEEVSGVYIDFVHYGGSNCDSLLTETTAPSWNTSRDGVERILSGNFWIPSTSNKSCSAFRIYDKSKNRDFSDKRDILYE